MALIQKIKSGLRSTETDYIRIAAATLIVLHAAMAAAGFVPYNFIIMFIGCILWIATGVQHRDRSIIIMNIVMAVLAFTAFINN